MGGLTDLTGRLESAEVDGPQRPSIAQSRMTPTRAERLSSASLGELFHRRYDWGVPL
jgi:hypothetical protein